MKLSQGVEWGMHCAVLLAVADDRAPVPRDALARHYGLSETNLAKHLQALARSGVLQATPGPQGGYRLARPAQEITMLDVLEAVEGRARPFVCQEIRQRGVGALPAEKCTRPCAIHAMMDDADEAWRASLRAVTVADMAARLTPATRAHIRRELPHP